MTDGSDAIKDGTVLFFQTGLGCVFTQYLKTESKLYEQGYCLSPLHKFDDDGVRSPYPKVSFDGKNWRRSPFVLDCPVLLDDFEADVTVTNEVAEAPPQGFRNSGRTPSIILDYASGAGPWGVYDRGESWRVSWLSSEKAQIPYLLTLVPERLAHFYFRSEDRPEYEINDRAIHYGQEQENQGFEPSLMESSHGLNQQPYPKISGRKAGLRAKDVIEVPTVRGLCYLQVTPYEYRIYGKLLRVFEGYWKTRPEPISSEIFRTKYLICCPFIRNALDDGRLQKVGRIDLIEDTGQCPPMRSAPNREGSWYMWGQGGRYMIALEEHAALSTTIGHSVSSIVDRLDLDWRPEIDLWTQVAVDRNQKRLAQADEEEIEALKEEEFL